MRVLQILVVAVALLPAAAVSARADELDDATRTVCYGQRCLGEYCTTDGDATNCWKESVYRRKGNEEVHWICTIHGHHCRWISGPKPEQDRWYVLHLGDD